MYHTLETICISYMNAMVDRCIATENAKGHYRGGMVLVVSFRAPRPRAASAFARLPGRRLPSQTRAASPAVGAPGPGRGGHTAQRRTPPWGGPWLGQREGKRAEDWGPAAGQRGVPPGHRATSLQTAGDTVTPPCAPAPPHLWSRRPAAAPTQGAARAGGATARRRPPSGWRGAGRSEEAAEADPAL